MKVFILKETGKIRESIRSNNNVLAEYNILSGFSDNIKNSQPDLIYMDKTCVYG